MLLICSGPDTWRARQKARELVGAFKAKHDKSGFSTEVIVGQGLGYVLGLIGMPSIFCPKRLIRFDGLLGGAKISELRQLAKRLKEDGENNIILTVEDEPPTEKTLSELNGIAVHQYPFPSIEGIKFKQWCQEQAKAVGLEPSVALEIAERCQGDTWMAINELEKFSANKDAPKAELEYEAGTAYEAVDQYFLGKSDWRDRIRLRSDEQIPSIIINQAKNAWKVKDNAPVKIPYFAVKKMQGFKRERIARNFWAGLISYVGSRTGLMSHDEGDAKL